MSADYLHKHSQFADLIRIVAQDKDIDPALVEKDYWIMHCLYGLKKLGLKYELKGGTSLSKGFQIIDRFSEDIDIQIEPPADQNVKTNHNQNKPSHIESRRKYYDWLANTISIDGIEKVERDTAFDNDTLLSAGIRLRYRYASQPLGDLRDGILLELGFDTVTPNKAVDISSWAYDYAFGKVEILDNRAKDVVCYDPGYTFVEKLQTISTKYRKQQATQEMPLDFMRHYYDVYCLLQRPDVQAFIGSSEYFAHKAKRFRKADNQTIAENEAFILSDHAVRKSYEEAFAKTSALYYGDRPTLGQILDVLGIWKIRL